MKARLAAVLALLPLPATAQSAFEQMVGAWRGEGSYVEGITEVQLRCRFQIDGDAAAIRMAGRCASSLGAETFSMDFERAAGGMAVVRSGESARAEGSSIDGLTGPLGRNGMVLKGSASAEAVTVQLLLNDDDTLVFATQEKAGGKTSTSYVTLSRQ